MGDIHYMISEAAKNVGVESHVLRYWEEELELSIGRTEMGHRYYTKEDMQLFQCIRKLKDEGVILRELKLLIPEIQKAKKFKKSKVEEIEKEEELYKVECKPAIEIVNFEEDEEEDKLHITEERMQNLLEYALKNNNQVLENEVCKLVTASMKKEMGYLFDAKEQVEEDRYRRLDGLIRQQQIYRKEQSRKPVSSRMKEAFGIA